MRLHAFVAVVGAECEKFGQILMPNVEIDGDRSRAHAELVDGNGGVVDQTNPANDAAGNAFKSANRRADRAHFPEIHAHAAAEF